MLEVDPQFRLPSSVASIIDRRSMGGLGIGLSGAHRTGKTTVAEHLAKANGFQFVKSSVSEIARSMRIDFSKPIPFKRRCEFQEVILETFQAAYDKVGAQMFVADRTPLDLAAYFLADVPTELADVELSQYVRDYVGRCVAVTNKTFLTTVVVQPAIPYIAEPGKPLPNPAYQDKFAAILLGLTHDERLTTTIKIMPKLILDNQSRVSFVAGHVQNDLGRAYDEAKTFGRA